MAKSKRAQVEVWLIRMKDDKTITGVGRPELSFTVPGVTLKEKKREALKVFKAKYPDDSLRILSASWTNRDTLLLYASPDAAPQSDKARDIQNFIRRRFPLPR